MISVSPGWVILPTWKSGQPAIHTAGATTETILRTIAMPAGFPGPNGIIRVTHMWRESENTNTKTQRIRFGAAGAGLGGTLLYNEAHSTALETNRRQFEFFNVNNAAIQTSPSTSHGSGGWGTSTGSLVAGAIDTAAAWEIVFSCIVATVTNFTESTYFTIEGCYGA